MKFETRGSACTRRTGWRFRHAAAARLTLPLRLLPEVGRTGFLVVAAVLLAAAVPSAAQEALSQGRQALAEGELDEALEQLTAAVESQPESVEARLALAECRLRRAELPQALAQYRAVLERSPDHRLATRMVAALEGTLESVADSLEAIEALRDSASYPAAEALINALLEQPLDRENRQRARLLQAELALWSGNARASLLAQKLTAEADPSVAGPAAVIAALSKAIHENLQGAEDAVAGIDPGDLPGTWPLRLEAVRLLTLSDDDALAQVERTGEVLAALPPGEFRDRWFNRVAQRWLGAVNGHLVHGRLEEAERLLWRFVSSEGPPDAVPADGLLTLEGGWLEGPTDLRSTVSERLLAVADRYMKLDAVAPAVRDYQAAFQVLGVPHHDTWQGRFQVTHRLEQILQDPQVRMRGPHADLDATILTFQRRLITTASTNEHLGHVIGLVHTRLQRFAGDHEAWQSAIADYLAATGQPVDTVQLQDPFQELAVEYRAQLLRGLASAADARADALHAEQQSNLIVDRSGLMREERIALLLDAQARALVPATDNTLVHKIVGRYANLAAWSAAREAISLAFTGESTSLEVSVPAQVTHLIELAIARENRLQAAARRLPDTLQPELREAIELVASYLQDEDAYRASLLPLLESVIVRYQYQNRPDLAERLLETVVELDEGAQLSDWVIWMRVEVSEVEAARQLAVAVVGRNGEPFPLQDAHQQELQQLRNLWAEYPESEYAPRALERLFYIVNTYRGHQAFAAAREALDQSVGVEWKPQIAERLAWAGLGITSAEASAALSALPAEEQPDELLEEHVRLLEELASFLNVFPDGNHALEAESRYFTVARAYAQRNAWSVARDIVGRLGQDVQDYHRPQYLELMEAVTYLGRLDAAYGLAHLVPPPRAASPASGPAEGAGGDAGYGERGGFEGLGDAFSVSGAMQPPGAMGPGGMPPGGQGSAGMGGGGGGFDTGGRGDGLPAIDALGESFFSGGVPADAAESVTAEPSATSLAMIRQAQERQLQQLAMLDSRAVPGQQVPQAQEELPQVVDLPTGQRLSPAEQQRQDEAADAAYTILVSLLAEDRWDTGSAARQHLAWTFGFFESQQRYQRAAELIRRLVADRPEDAARPALEFRAIQNRFAHAARPPQVSRRTLPWLDERQEAFAAAREELRAFRDAEGRSQEWIRQAQLKEIESYVSESQLAAPISRVRAGGPLVRAAEALLSLFRDAPDHPQVSEFPQRIWQLAEQLQGLGQTQEAVYVLSQITIGFPTHPLAASSLQRIADLHAANLARPLEAVKVYQEYLATNGDSEPIRTAIFTIAEQLSGRLRYLEALHVYGAFVDSFPDDPRAPQALQAMGRIHQTNGSWVEATEVYERLLEEYAGAAVVPEVKLAIAECLINQSRWLEARRSYEEFATDYSGHGQVGLAQSRIEVLKTVERFQNLLDDEMIERNKDDAQFRIGQIVLQQLANHVKAIEEFRKVVAEYPGSDVADDAQLEVGKALLALNRADEARRVLLELPERFPNSPLADNALFLVGQSYEQLAQQLAQVTSEQAWAAAFGRNQAFAYREYNRRAQAEDERQTQLREELKQAGEDDQLALNEAANAARANNLIFGELGNTSRMAEQDAERESALEVANRQDRIHEALREAVAVYDRLAADYPLGDRTDDSLLRVARIYETELNDRVAAMRTYERVVELFPGTPVAEDAAWNVAVFHEREGRYAEAAEAFREFIRNYPASGRVADAQFALAEALEQLGQWVDAMDAYETFRQKFGDHPKAQLAVEQINWIRTYRK